MIQISINSISGCTYPIDVYVADIYGNNRNLIGTISSGPVPPTQYFNTSIPTIFEKANEVMLILVDANNCEKFNIIVCPTQTPTPTNTETPTPTYTSTPTMTQTPTETPISSSTPTMTQTTTETPTMTQTPTETPTMTQTTTETPTQTQTPTTTETPTITPSPTTTETPTMTQTPTITPSPTEVLDSFIATIRTTNTSVGSSSSDQFALPFISTGIYNVIVDWGDGGPTNTITTWNDIATTHTYNSSGDYQITISSKSGNFLGWRFNNTGDRLKLLSVQKWGPIRLGTTQGSYFYGCSNLTLTSVVDILNTSGTTSFTEIFRSCTSLTTVNNINSWNTSAVTSLNSAFRSAGSFNDDLNNWDVSNVTNFSGTFANASSFDKDLGDWNTRKGITFYEMFANATDFDNAGSNSISGWTLSAVTNNAGGTGYMFYAAENFNRNISNWCRNFDNQYGLQSNFGNNVQFTYMFAGLTASNRNIFNNDNDPGINGWITTKITDMGHMFYNTSAFNQPIGSWNVISVSASTSNAGMRNMFGNSVFNQNIGSWNMINVRRVDDMFNNNTVFNNNSDSSISTWILNSCITTARMFSNADSFNQPIDNWGNSLSAVTDMSGMFIGNSGFNQPIGSWDVSSVQNMSTMFQNATAFNQDISNWNPINVTSMVNFMTGKTTANYSSTYYDNLLNSWSTKALQSNVSANFGTIQYTVTGQPGRNTLTSAPYNWTIVDGGLGP